MNLSGVMDKNQIDNLSKVYLIFLTPSVIGSFSVLVVSIVRWRHLREQVHLLVQLALADLLAAAILMSTAATNIFSNGNTVIRCLYSLPLSLTFYFISFLLVVVYAWKSKTAIQGWRARPTEDESGLCQSGVQNLCRRTSVTVPVYGLVWLFPIALYLLYVLTMLVHKITSLTQLNDASPSVLMGNDTKYCTSCILFLHVWRDPCSPSERSHDIFITVFLILVVIPVMLSCSVIYYKVGKWYKEHEQVGLFPVEGDGRSRKRFKKMFSTARNMVMVVLFCWTPALVIILLSALMIWTNIEQHSLFFFYMLQAATVSLQGFLNSMVYAWRRPNFTEAVLGENTPLVAQNHLSFFDESLRSSSRL